MRYDSNAPAIANAVPLESIAKTEAVTLDLSKRNKIVIYAKTKESTTKNVPLRRSIFSRRLEKGTPGEGAQAGKSTEDVDAGQQPRLSPKARTTTNNATGGASLERLAKEQKPIQGAARLDYCVRPDHSVPPGTVFTANGQTPSQYAIECANCPCSIRGGSPCQRCRLLRLADRLCNLVDTQCEKWKSEPRSEASR